MSLVGGRTYCAPVPSVRTPPATRSSSMRAITRTITSSVLNTQLLSTEEPSAHVSPPCDPRRTRPLSSHRTGRPTPPAAR